MSDAEEWKPGQDTQAVATARLQGQDPDKIHCPAWGVIGNLGDSICYAGRAREGRGDPGRAAAPGRRCRSPGAGHRAQLRGRDLRRAAQRHAGDAVLADRPRDHQRRRVPPPGRERRARRDRRGRLRQAPGGDPRRDPRAQRPRGDHVRRLDPPWHRLPYRRADRHHLLLPGGGGAAGGAAADRAGGLARPRQLRRHVHLQHHAVVHRDLRHGAAAHGGPGVGGSAAASRSSPPSCSTRCRCSPSATSGRATSSPRRRCATPRWWPSRWAVPPTSCSTRPSWPAPRASTSGAR